MHWYRISPRILVDRVQDFSRLRDVYGEDETKFDDVAQDITKGDYEKLFLLSNNTLFAVKIGVPRRSGRHRQTICREDRHIIRHTSIASTISLFAIHTQAAPSLWTSVSVRTIGGRLTERQLVLQCPMRVLPFTPTHCSIRLEWCHARRD
ncbi:hypothetical protein TNCV_1457681 [Trichonephila clavipes]|nr:hypothetical protein TNCV_1457681 [Trichonephila clavipes]